MMFYGNPNVVLANLATPPQQLNRDVWFAADNAGAGARTDHQPGSPMPALPFNGWLQGGINSFLYGRIYITPSVVALGNLVSSQTRQFSVWNATFVANTVSDITSVGDAGLTLTQPIPTPYVLAPLAQQFYTLNIGVDGPANMDAIYTLMIGGVSYTVEVTGARVVIWPFQPNWSTPVNETLEWKSDVLKAYNGSEQRIELRAIPRRGLSYDFMLKGGDAQQFDNITWGWQNRAFAVPYWQYRGKTTAPIGIGSLTIPVVTADVGYVAGQTLALFLSADVYEILQIAPGGVAPTLITLANATALAWPLGSSVYPASVSTIPSNIPVNRQTSGVLTGSVAFAADPIRTDPFLPVTVAPNIYNGYEIILEQPDWAAPIDSSATFNYDRVDFNVGDVNFATTDTYQSLVYKYRWIRKSRTSVTAFRAFLARLNGLVNPVYLPNWHEDFTLALPIGLADVTITVVDRSFFLLVGQNPARANIYIRTKTHGNFLRPINQVGKTGANASINIGTALGVNVPISDVLQICYVSLYRKSSDLSTIQWQSQQVAIIEEVFQLVPA
jgi:hypothetical protein